MDDMFKMGLADMHGEIWDEKGGSEIKEILISHQHESIDSIRFTYRKDKRGVINSQTYGKPNGLNFKMVAFDWPQEGVTSLSGAYNDGKLVSLTIGTNKKKYGPFGSTAKRSDKSSYQNFNYEISTGRFGGFYGSVSDDRVQAIGIYLRPYVVYTTGDSLRDFEANWDPYDSD